MDTKQIIAIMAIAAVAFAGIGAAYAFSASLDNEDNSAAVGYWKLSLEASSNGATADADPDGKLFSEAYTEPIPFDTKTVYEQRAGDAAKKQYIDILPVTLANQVLSANIAPLGWLTFSVADQDDAAVPVAEAGKNYPFTISIEDAMTYNEHYYLFAAMVPLDETGDKPVIDYEDIEEVVLFELVNGKYTATLMTVPADETDATKVGDFTVAIFAMPKSFESLSSLEKASFSDQGGKKKTDVLQDAVFQFAITDEAVAPAEITAIDILVEPTKLEYNGVPADKAALDLKGMIIVTDAADGKRIVSYASNDVTASIAAPDTDAKSAVTMTYSEKTDAFSVDVYQTVTFKVDADTVYQINKVAYDHSTTAPAVAPVIPGRAFEGWFDNETEFSTETKFTQNATYTAKWGIPDAPVTAPTAESAENLVLSTEVAQVTLIVAGASSVEGTWTYKITGAGDYSTELPKATMANTYSVEWKFTPTDTTAYKEVTGTVSGIVVTQANNP